MDRSDRVPTEAVEWHIKQQALARYDRFAPTPIATVLSPSPAFRRVPDAHITFLLTHFTHHHLRRNGHPEAYARLYMRILQSLRRGGQFIYTPGLLFIEGLLPAEQYDVHRRAINRAPALPGDALLDGTNYAAVITRC